LHTYKCDATTDNGNAEYNLVPFSDEAVKLSSGRKYPLNRVFTAIPIKYCIYIFPVIYGIYSFSSFVDDDIKLITIVTYRVIQNI
jgi:hypothetical protein